MMKIQVRNLAMGAALAAFFAAHPLWACKLHIPTNYDGLGAAHPASVPVSLATRQAVVSKSLVDIPRATKQQKHTALAQIEGRFRELIGAAPKIVPDTPLAFSIYLTESNHWAHFDYDGNGWTVIEDHPLDHQDDVTLVLSDTALMNLLSKSMEPQKARELGVLAVSGKADAQARVLQVFSRFLDAYTA